MPCEKCGEPYLPDELDSDGLCFACANNDPDYEIDTTAIVKELIETTMDNLAEAKNITSTELKNELVAEHARKNPEKYAKEQWEQMKIPINKEEKPN